MGLNYKDGFADLDTAFEGLKDAIIEGVVSPAWALVYTNNEGNNLSLNTVSGTEFTDNKLYALRGKLETNTGGTADVEYAYLILEKDDAFNRIIVRTCQSFTSGGVSTNVTPFSDVTECELYLDTLSIDNAVSFCGIDQNVTITVRSVSGVTAIVLAQIDSTPSGNIANNNYALTNTMSSGVYVVENTNIGGCYEKVIQDDVPLSHGTSLIAVPIGISNNTDEFAGYLGYVGHLNTAVPSNYDILTIYNEDPSDPDMILFESATGFTAVEL